MKNSKRVYLTVFMICFFFISGLSVTADANSAEPPSITILVQQPPADFCMELVTGQELIKAKVRKIAWEGYYSFYSRDLKRDDTYTFKITANGESFQSIIEPPLYRYQNIYTLDLTHQTMVSGTYPFRTLILVSMRILLTLLIEGIVFWLFGYRQKRSWVVFVLINLITQGGLNIWLSQETLFLSVYLIFALILGEVFVFAIEMIAFPRLIKEHKKLRTLLYAFTANLCSLIAGSFIITRLPV